MLGVSKNGSELGLRLLNPSLELSDPFIFASSLCICIHLRFERCNDLVLIFVILALWTFRGFLCLVVLPTTDLARISRTSTPNHRLFGQVS